ncbi:MAG: hypothetical protein ACI9BD_000151 [Candidatus Marinamargulisbacteria bacterium]|jgi:hypothetical protein
MNGLGNGHGSAYAHRGQVVRKQLESGSYFEKDNRFKGGNVNLEPARSKDDLDPLMSTVTPFPHESTRLLAEAKNETIELYNRVAKEDREFTYPERLEISALRTEIESIHALFKL